jgi:hypothetical protein
MKIALVSDVHLEFGDLDFDNTDSAEVLILTPFGYSISTEDFGSYLEGNSFSIGKKLFFLLPENFP